MINTTKTLFVLITVLFWGCNQQEGFEFKKEASLKGVEFITNDTLTLGKLIVFDSLLLVQQRDNGNKCLRILDLNSHRFISAAAKMGRGPGEIANPANVSIDEEGCVLWHSDWGKNKVQKFPIDSMVLNPDFKPTESFPLDKGLIPMMNMFYHPSGNFGFSSFNLQKNLATFINKHGEIIDSLAIPNKIYPDIWEDAGPSDNAIILHYNPIHEKFVVASRFKNNIAVIDEQGNPSFQIKGAPAESKSFYRTFYTIDSDEEYIYCIYKGGAIQGYDKETQRGAVYYPNRLLVFDWQGVGRYDITLDHPLVFCALDKERKRLIGSTEDFENGLVTYDVSELYRK